MEMEGIEHKMVEVNGIKMHIAEKGSGPAVLLLHGFPEFWYSWRHQIVGLAARGYRAVAPDMRGFGDTDAPPLASSYTVFHIVGDVVALLDALGLDKVYVVGHDWGALISWYLSQFRPDRVKAVVALSVTFFRRNPSISFLDGLHHMYGDDYYMWRFQPVGTMEEDFAQNGTERMMKIFLTLRDPGPLIVPKQGFKDWPAENLTLHPWWSEDDIRLYTEKFNKSGFTGGLNYYRALNLSWELIAPWSGSKVLVPAKFIVGDLDLTYDTMGTKEYIESGKFKEDVPLLEDVVIMKGVGHWINNEKPDEITAHILDFISKF